MTRPYTCQNFYLKFSPTSKDKLAKATPTDSSGTFIPTFVMSPASTPYFAIAIAGTCVYNSLC